MGGQARGGLAVVDSSTGLLDIERARDFLAKCRNLDDVREIRDRAKAVEAYQRSRRASLEAQQDAAEIALRAERRLGEMCAEITVRGQPKEMSTRTTLPELGISRDQSSRWQTLARIPETDFEAHVRTVRENGEKLTTAGAIRAVSDSSDHDGDEYYTPEPLIEDARKVLGGIDVDPASCAFAQNVVRATHFYTKEDSGLDHLWMGRVFANPPFSHPLIALFADKFLGEIEAGRTDAGLFLCNTTDAKFYHRLLRQFPACISEGRISFYTTAGTHSQNRQGQTIFYHGEDLTKFRLVFGKYGTVVRALL
ncbi:MAG: DNA N-6-adenine-methyltransferase [Myxococcota bacterium]